MKSSIISREIEFKGPQIYEVLYVSFLKFPRPKNTKEQFKAECP